MTPLMRLIKDLNVIGNISIGNKLILFGEFIDIDRSVMPSLTRKLMGQDRDKCYYKLAERICDAGFYISLIMESAHFHEGPSDDLISYVGFRACDRLTDLEKIKAALQQCIRGIENLKYTYDYDTSMQLKLGNLTGDIRAYIAKIDSFLNICMNRE